MLDQLIDALDLNGALQRGWTLISECDLREEDRTADLEICRRCNSPIRHVRYLKHPNYPHQIVVGRTCATHLTKPEVVQGQAKRPKPKQRPALGRRESGSWSRYSDGRPYRRIRAYLTVIVPWGEGFRLKLKSPYQNGWVHGKQMYFDESTAKRAAHHVVRRVEAAERCEPRPTPREVRNLF